MGVTCHDRRMSVMTRRPASEIVSPLGVLGSAGACMRRSDAADTSGVLHSCQANPSVNR
jgi:hypothetical protein